MNSTIRYGCATGEFYDPLRGCQLCSLIQSPYQEVLCPCEPSRDAVIGCKSSSNGNNLCRPRSAALDECARRGYTSSHAPGTTAAASSTAEPKVAPARSSSAAAFAGESTQPSSTTVSRTISGNPSSSDASPLLAIGVGVGVSLVVLFLLIGAVVLYLARLRRKTLRRRRVIFEVEEHEAAAISKKLIDRNSVASRLNLNDVSTPQEAVVNGTVPYVDLKPSVIKNYSVVLAGGQFTQYGSRNVMSVAEIVSSAMKSAADLNSEDEDQVSSADDSGALGDVNDQAVSSSLSDGAFSGQFAYYQPMPGNVGDLGEAGNVRQGNAEKSYTGEVRTEGFVSRGLSANRSGEERCQSSHASLEHAEAGSVLHSSNVHGLLECSEDLTDTRDRGYESAAPDMSHMPTENSDYVSQEMPATTNAPSASLPAGGAGSNINSELLPSPPCDKEWRTPSVSGQCAGGAMVPLASVSSSMSSRYDSVDCGGDKESLPMHPQAVQSISAGKPGMLVSLSERPTGTATPNLDDDPTLPKQPTGPLLSVIGNIA